jgi:hypothetical protein
MTAQNKAKRTKQQKNGDLNVKQGNKNANLNKSHRRLTLKVKSYKLTLTMLSKKLVANFYLIKTSRLQSVIITKTRAR